VKHLPHISALIFSTRIMGQKNNIENTHRGNGGRGYRIAVGTSVECHLTITGTFVATLKKEEKKRRKNLRGFYRFFRKLVGLSESSQ
jgi:hypothetical protein